MKCDICGDDTTNKRVCDRCTKIMNSVIKDVGPDIWNSIEDCRYIYPMIKRVVDGSLRTQDIVKEILKGG